MKWSTLLPLILAMGCTEKTPDDTSTQDTDTDTDTAPTEAPWNNICEGVPGDDHEILFSGYAYHDALAMNPELLISSQTDWETFESQLIFQNLSETLPRTTFDWSIEEVAVLSVYETSTCGLTLLAGDSCIINGQSQLYLAVEDSSGECDAVCEADGQVMLIVAKPIGDTAYTQEVVPGCPSE